MTFLLLTFPVSDSIGEGIGGRCWVEVGVGCWGGDRVLQGQGSESPSTQNATLCSLACWPLGPILVSAPRLHWRWQQGDAAARVSNAAGQVAVGTGEQALQCPQGYEFRSDSRSGWAAMPSKQLQGVTVKSYCLCTYQGTKKPHWKLSLGKSDKEPHGLSLKILWAAGTTREFPSGSVG